MVLAYNSHDSYLIIDYDILQNSGAIVSYNLDCHYPIAPPPTSSNLWNSTNISKSGKFVWNVDLHNCETGILKILYLNLISIPREYLSISYGRIFECDAADT